MSELTIHTYPWKTTEAQALIDELAVLRKRAGAAEARVKDLENWQRIVTGAGTDQESIIRMMASEYTKTAVQCWKERVAKLETRVRELEFDIAASGIPSHTLPYTPDKPTVAGWYWWKGIFHDEDSPQILEVTHFEGLPDKALCVSFGGGYYTRLEFVSGEWAGPIPLPKEGM